MPKIASAHWRQLFRPGDFVTLLLGLCLCGLAVQYLWQGGAPEKAIVRVRGEVIAELPLNQAQTVSFNGPLGPSVIEVAPGRARVQSDPGPHQYCVKQGWLNQRGAIAICAPNEVSLMLVGRNISYDSLSY